MGAGRGGSGDWALDGFVVGQIIEVTGSNFNDGEYVIQDIVRKVLTLDPTLLQLAPAGTDLTQEGPQSDVSVAVKKVSMTGAPTW